MILFKCVLTIFVTNNLCRPTLEKEVSKVGQHVLTNVGQSNILCYSIDKMCIKKVKCHKCNFVNFGAYNAAILFVLRTRF